MKFYLYCDRPTSGGMALIRALGGKRIRVGRSRFKPGRNKRAINWGCTGAPEYTLNPPSIVAGCTNKLHFFKIMENRGRSTFLPTYTEAKAVALRWIAEKKAVVCRTVLNGHSGNGIVIAKKVDQLIDAPLYTLYVPKDEEYRIHCISKEDRVHLFYQQKKVKRAGFEGKHNRKVRSWDNGYTYQHSNIEVPAAVTNAVCEVFVASGLDFGAVDVIYCRDANKAYVLEINTAPGLEGYSVERYAEAFKQHFR